MNVHTRYIRKGKLIIAIPQGQPLPDTQSQVETFKSVNAAKKRSHELQKANGGLGKGFVRVER